eukprot:SAG11_NODE_1073_length_5973_cov_34.243616_2_plen_255_part_00
MCPPTKCCYCDLEDGVKQTASAWITSHFISIALSFIFVTVLAPVCTGEGEKNLGESWGTDWHIRCTYTCCEEGSLPWDESIDLWDDYTRWSNTTSIGGSACSNAWCSSPDGEGGYDCCALDERAGERKTCSTGEPATTNPDLMSICKNQDGAFIGSLIGTVLFLGLVAVQAIAVGSMPASIGNDKGRHKFGMLWKVHAALTAIATIFNLLGSLVMERNAGGMAMRRTPRPWPAFAMQSAVQTIVEPSYLSNSRF